MINGVSRGWQPRDHEKKLRTKAASSVERRNRSRVFGSARMTGSAFARRAMGCRGMLPAGLDGARSTPTRPPTPPCTFATGSQTYLRRNSGFFILLSFPNNLMPTMGKIIPLGARSATTTTTTTVLWQRGEGDGYYHVDEYLREIISASRLDWD